MAGWLRLGQQKHARGHKRSEPTILGSVECWLINQFSGIVRDDNIPPSDPDT